MVKYYELEDRKCDKDEYYATLDKYIDNIEDNLDKIIFAFEHNHNKLELFEHLYKVTNVLVTKNINNKQSGIIINMYVSCHQLTFEKTNLEIYNKLIDKIFNQYFDIYETFICLTIDFIARNLTYDKKYKLFITKYINSYIEKDDNLIYFLRSYSFSNMDRIYDFSRVPIDRFFSIMRYFSETYFRQYISHIVIPDNIPETVRNEFINNLIYFSLIEKVKLFHDFTIEHLRTAIKRFDTLHNKDSVYDVFNYILDHKIIPDNSCFDLLKLEYLNCSRLVNSLLIHGYVLTRENIIRLCKYGIEIRNFDNYGIEVDNEIFTAWCNNMSKTIPNYIKKFKITHEDFYNYFKTKLLNIQKFVRLSNWKLDITCLENACTVNKNNKNINFILKKVKPNLQCIKNLVNNLDIYNFIEKNYIIIKKYIVINGIHVEFIDNKILMLRYFRNLLYGKYYKTRNTRDTLLKLIYNL
jgi:hypothetical protein